MGYYYPLKSPNLITFDKYIKNYRYKQFLKKILTALFTTIRKINFLNHCFLSFQRSEGTNGAMGDIGVSQAELVGPRANARRLPQYLAALSGEF